MINRNLHALRVMLKGSVESASDNIVDEYVDRLEQIIHDMDAAGFDLARVEKEFVASTTAGDVDSLIQLSCELSAAHYFMQKYSARFDYHVENESTQSATGTSKSYDFSFVSDGQRFNVEVKTLSGANRRDGSPYKFFLPKSQLKALREQGARPSRNRLPAISDFMRYANNQLPSARIGVNVLLLCSRDLDEYADAIESVFGVNGIMNNLQEMQVEEPINSIFPKTAEISNIDAIVFSNLGFGHACVFDSSKLKDFYGDESTELTSGTHPWSYRFSLPIAAYLSKKKAVDNAAVELHKSFESLSSVYEQYRTANHGDSMLALFDLFNSALSNERS